ncbi:YegP family protein [Streptomyces sp. NPDC058611]|uniref:YegP family protein n=1 Tax=unclassified Streptomyces TaxID=2593676 RepID=UPI003659343B
MHNSTKGICHGGAFRGPAPAGQGCHFVLIATNGQVIATSEHYESHRSCLNGIDSVKRNADAPIRNDTGTSWAARRHRRRCHRRRFGGSMVDDPHAAARAARRQCRQSFWRRATPAAADTPHERLATLHASLPVRRCLPRFPP